MKRDRRPAGPALAALVALVALALLGSSCAYYNTFYLARKYYGTAAAGLPYSVDPPTGAHAGNYQKSIDYSKKLIANYPKSKWVDDAYLLWAQALLGKNDPLQTITMLEEFSARFPTSSRKHHATFYLGVAYRQARKYRESLTPLGEFVAKAPNDDLAPYAHLERSRALVALDRYAEAAEAAGRVIERFPKSPLVPRLLAARAEALLAGGDPGRARADFQALGLRAVDDNERFTYLLREADCLEKAREFDAELELLNGALAHEPPPARSAGGAAPTGPGADRYGQLTLRIGTVHLLAGRAEQALSAYGNVIQDYPKTPLAAEAQYRIGYAHETVLDDFDAARNEYAKVREHSTSSAFLAQAIQRQQSLDRLAGFRSAGVDSVDKQVEAGFLLAEQYLFQLDKPERALEAYAAIAREHAGSPAAGKALNAEAWVLRRRLGRPAEADSLLWTVVRQYPATEAQLAARDYLEGAGHQVPTALIRLPERPLAAADTTRPLTRPPEGREPLGAPRAATGRIASAPSDSLARLGPGAGRPASPGDEVAEGPAGAGAPASPAAPSLAPPRPGGSAPPDSGLGSPPRGGSPLDDPPRPAPERPAPAAADTSGTPR